ncbi:hypothetical protein ACFXHA_13315 [Nocardia sp. NPDC059240]|uniref:hypothetical protein n=1 Tax=Nocardia sp. NPDC059240 TaxID=3346786 RepID=UPI0036838773
MSKTLRLTLVAGVVLSGVAAGMVTASADPVAPVADTGSGTGSDNYTPGLPLWSGSGARIAVPFPFVLVCMLPTVGSSSCVYPKGGDL